MVHKLFEDTAERMGLLRIKTVGERFDPAVHEAIQQKESDEAPPGTILSEVVPGYRFGERLVRAAVVVVARKPAEKPAGTGTPSAAPAGTSAAPPAYPTPSNAPPSTRPPERPKSSRPPPPTPPPPSGAPPASPSKRPSQKPEAGGNGEPDKQGS
jgi:hypothetical protein